MSVQLVAVLVPALVAAFAATNPNRVRSDQLLPFGVAVMGIVCFAILFT
jgi:hypothetical protein